MADVVAVSSAGARVSTVEERIEAARLERVKEADAVHTLATLEDQRHLFKLAAIERLAANSTQPISGKPHSYSSAESLAETDEAYASYLAELREAARQRILVAASAWALRLQAELAVRLAAPSEECADVP